MLKDTGFVKSRNLQSYKIFTDKITDDFKSFDTWKASDYVKECWKRYGGASLNNNSMNGTIFEYIIGTALYNKGILPMFLQASMAFVPNTDFDILLYTSDNFPIGISIKTSLRERYKQADLEAIALKYVHRRALNYLITFSGNEANNVKNKIKTGTLLGINEVITADTNEFDIFINNLSQYTFIEPGKIDIITSATKIKL